jgi:hypothetical protein
LAKCAPSSLGWAISLYDPIYGWAPAKHEMGEGHWPEEVFDAFLCELASCRHGTTFFMVIIDGRFSNGVMIGDSTSARLARSLAIVRESTSAQPQVLRVLFYGQSMTSPHWTDLAVEHLRRTYPHTKFVVRNMGIGGFSAKQLERTVERDVTDFYPDLLIFHAYGDHRAYERIIRIIRSRTAAEVIVQTDPVKEPVEPLCPEGFHLTLIPPPGCKGVLYYKQHSWEEYMSSVIVPSLASHYALAVEPRRSMWSALLREKNIQPTNLLDGTGHPNAAGWQLAAEIFDRYFDKAVADYSGERSGLVMAYPPPANGDLESYQFNGNRVEIIGSGPLDGRVTARIDGLEPNAIDGCWQTSRTTSIENVPDWPAIRQVTISSGFNQAETWTATVTHLNSDQSDFDFTIVGSKTGPDGQGRANSDFTSPSGRVRIAAADWMIPSAFALTQQKLPEGFKVSWSRDFVCRDLPTVPLDEGAIEVRHILATGLPNGPHLLTLEVQPSVETSVNEIRVYRPPLLDPPN